LTRNGLRLIIVDQEILKQQREQLFEDGPEEPQDKTLPEFPKKWAKETKQQVKTRHRRWLDRLVELEQKLTELTSV